MSIANNVRIYGLYESMVASGYPMLTEPPTETEFQALICERSGHKKLKNLANTPSGSGHDQALTGIIVQFDLTFSIKAWTEAERYHFLDFVSSMSTIHKLTKMNFDNVFNTYVTENSTNEMKRLLAIYNENPTKENELTLLYNCPTGLNLTARMTTNYRQLKTIYSQRKNHKLPEWRGFCEWIKTLPYAEEFIIR